MAERLGFPRPDPTLIATAISEIARTSSCTSVAARSSSGRSRSADRYGLIVIAKDEGPGIRDIEAALRDDYSGRSGLGLGLPGARRLMDDFDLTSSAEGTTVTMRSGDSTTSSRACARSAVVVAERAVAGTARPGAWPPGSRPGEAANGDLAVVALTPEGVLDRGDRRTRPRWRRRGARPARQAGSCASAPSRDLVLLAELCHDALRDTRGAAIGLAFVSPPEAHDDLARHRQRRGAGARAAPVRHPAEGLSRPWKRRPRPPAAEHESRNARCRPGDVLVLATDGIQAVFADSLDVSGSAQAITDRILAVHRRPTDDALVVAVRYLGARP